MAMIVISGRPGWLSTVQDTLPEGFEPVVYEDLSRYAARLVDDGPAMILVDGARIDWRAWVTTPKTSPATRRIPVIVIGAAAVQQRALDAGADDVLTPDSLADRLPGIVRARARVVDSEDRALLETQCAEPLPPEALEAIDLFNAGEFYKQHDQFELLWMAETGPVRDLYRAVLQVGVAYYQVTRGNRRGALKMLMRAVQWLDVLPDACRGVDVAQLRRDAARVRAVLEQTPPDAMDGFDRSLLQPVKLLTP